MGEDKRKTKKKVDNGRHSLLQNFPLFNEHLESFRIIPVDGFPKIEASEPVKKSKRDDDD